MSKHSFALAAILAAATFSLIAAPMAYADSTTNQEITNKQHGDASGQSTVNQCANNLIDSGNGELPENVGACTQDQRTPP